MLAAATIQFTAFGPTVEAKLKPGAIVATNTVVQDNSGLVYSILEGLYLHARSEGGWSEEVRPCFLCLSIERIS